MGKEFNHILLGHDVVGVTWKRGLQDVGWSIAYRPCSGLLHAEAAAKTVDGAIAILVIRLVGGECRSALSRSVCLCSGVFAEISGHEWSRVRVHESQWSVYGIVGERGTGPASARDVLSFGECQRICCIHHVGLGTPYSRLCWVSIGCRSTLGLSKRRPVLRAQQWSRRPCCRRETMLSVSSSQILGKLRRTTSDPSLPA